MPTEISLKCQEKTIGKLRLILRFSQFVSESNNINVQTSAQLNYSMKKSLSIGLLGFVIRIVCKTTDLYSAAGVDRK